MLRLLPVIISLFFASLGQAATIVAASCSQADVASALSTAARNDTVQVPAGTCTWATPVTITKGVTLTGAGAGVTVITSSGGSILIDGEPDSTTIANSDNIKVSGFTFDGASSACLLMALEGASGVSGTKPYRYYIIGTNTFRNGCTTGANGIIQSQANGNGQIRGVIYNNTFDRCNILWRVFSNNDTGESGNATFNAPSYGVEDNLYFESNTILFSSSFSGDNPGWSEFGQGGRAVARYNNYNFANATSPQEIWDIHGFQNWNGTVNSGQTGTMLTEFYGNTLTNVGQFRWIDHRATQGLFFDNILTGTSGAAVQVYGLSAGASCASDINPTPSNYIPIVNNSYFFNNTNNGTNSLAVDGGGIAFMACTPAENTNWWNQNASCTSSTCAAGVGQGTTAPTGTCTTGVGYWVAPTATATASSAVIQAGTLYKCTSTNTWTAYYRPYTYPHPLRATLAISNPTVTNTSAGVTLSGATANDCTIEVSLSPTYAPVIPDLDGTEYAGANTCSGRSDTAINAGTGSQILVQIGHKVTNRALLAATRYYLRVTSGADVATTSFVTETIGIGQTFPWPSPVDRRRRFNRGFGPTPAELVTKASQVDPVTGAQLWPIGGMNDITGREGPFSFFYWTDATGWVNPGNVVNTASTGAQTNNTNPITLYFDPNSDPNNLLYTGIAWNDVGIVAYACGDDPTAGNRTFTLTLSNNFSTGHMGTPVTVTGVPFCSSPPTGLPQVLSTSTDINHPWPSQFPSAPFAGWGNNVLIGWDDRPTWVVGSTTSNVFTASSYDGLRHFSPLLEIGNKIGLPGCSQGSGVCDITTLGGAGKVTISGATNGSATATALRSGVQIQKSTATGHLWVSVKYKTADAWMITAPGGALATVCNTNAGPITTGDGHVGYLCIMSSYQAGNNVMMFMSSDGTSRLVWAGGMPQQSYFTSLSPPFAPGDVPQVNSNLFQVAQVLPDPADARGWYLYLSNAPPFEVYHLHYSGTVPVIDTAYNLDMACSGAEPPGSFCRSGPINYPSDGFDWKAINPSSGGGSLASQLASFPYYPSSIFGTGFTFFGASGFSLYFENIAGGQDHPGWVAVGDMSTGSFVLKNVFSSYDGQGINGKTNYGSIHNINPRIYPPDTMVMSLNTSDYQGGDTPGHSYNNSFSMPIVAVDRGTVGTPTWSTNTALPAASNGSYLSTCPTNSWGFTGTNCVHLKFAKGGFCNIGPNIANEPRNCPTSPAIAGTFILTQSGSPAAWTASSFSQPFPAREGNVFSDTSPASFCNPVRDCEQFQIISPLTLEGDGYSSAWIGRDAGYDYCTIRGFASADTSAQYVHNTGWVGLANPNQGKGCSAGLLVVQGQTQGTTTVTEVPHNLVGHTDIVEGSSPGRVAYVAADAANDTASVSTLFDLTTVKHFATPTWHGSATSIGGGVQSYSNSPGKSSWFTDANSVNGNAGTGPEITYAPLGTASTVTTTSCADVYQITVSGTSDYKNIPLRVVAGSWPLEEVSSPTVDLCSGAVPAHTWAYALSNGEAMHGTITGAGTSLAGEVFIKVPNAQADNFGYGQCNTGQHWANTPCALGGNYIGGGFYRQRDLLQNDPTSVRSRALTSGMEVVLAQYSYSGIVPIDPNLSWVAWSYNAGWGITPWILKMPSYVDDSASFNRTDRMSATVPATAKSGSTHVRVRFGRNPSFQCWGSESTAADGTLAWSGRREACVTDNSGSTPFKFSSESQTLLACATTCNVTVPLIPQVVYYAQTEYLNSGGTVLATDPVMFLSVGGVTASPCSTLSISPTSLSILAAGASGSLTVTADIACTWAAGSVGSWITATGGATGNGSIAYTIATNAGSARSGSITADTVAVAVSQFGAGGGIGGSGPTISGAVLTGGKVQ